MRLCTIQCDLCTSCAACLEYRVLATDQWSYLFCFRGRNKYNDAAMWSHIEFPFAYSYHRSSMRTLSLHIATTVLVAICKGRVHMIFSWLSKGTHIAPLDNNGIHVHLHTLHSSHFVPRSFRTQVISHNVGHFVPYSFLALLDVDQRSFTEVDLSGARLSVRLSV